MSWDQLGELADAGWEIGSHTRTHPHLTQSRRRELRAELESRKATVEERLGRPCPTLAYPYGDYDERVVAAAGAAGYAAAGTLPARLHSERALAWPRVGIYHGGRRAPLPHEGLAGAAAAAQLPALAGRLGLPPA